MKKILLVIIAFGPLILQAYPAREAYPLSEYPDSAQVKIPFNWYLGWINGQNRQHDFPLTVQDKKGETILTAGIYLDSYFNYNFAQPKDNTQTISAVMGRSNEFSVNLFSFGLESDYKNVIGRLWFQTGSMLHIVQETDGSVFRGRNTGTGNLKFIREAGLGYHFPLNYGLNVELGIFLSYIGLESYLTQENWSYQRSMVCEFTPFYFQGARLQYYPVKNFRTELWILNGWQTYNSWSKNSGLGFSNYFRPNENMQLVANFYYGTDSQSGTPTLSRIHRFHHDDSFVFRYLKRPNSLGLSQAAFSINNHYGFQSGEGVKASKNYMAGSSLANRLWFRHNTVAWTLRGDYLTNPGAYLAFVPAAPANGPNAFDLALASGQNLKLTQISTTLDIMPSDWITFRLEYGFRKSNVPYFAGPGGTTSQTGFTNDPLDPNWRPDLRKTENRITLALNFRL